MKGLEGLLKLSLFLQLLWYVFFFTNILGGIGSYSEPLQDIIWLGIPISGLIIAITYAVKRRTNGLVLLVILLSSPILILWGLISFISIM